MKTKWNKDWLIGILLLLVWMTPFSLGILIAGVTATAFMLLPSQETTHSIHGVRYTNLNQYYPIMRCSK